ncbi:MULTISPECIES: SHOCT domain-containing protein [Streptomyces]|uniref:SHOCT domain-containing protein n=1 Tax=Streptomyces durocortorensis TaxID=2811104 RepID=A0ABS2HXQ2_9ACTN|nr:SHOCT domain-containing protein [Streptomyces durocortorensis]MBM7055153.1 SHOCT domain-containing protein [Streptomyces durocortorensis]
MAVGPVEYLVIAFPGSRFTGSFAPALADAVASGAVRPGDLAFVRRAEGGPPASVELRELDPEGVVPAGAGQGGAAPVLSAEDVDRFGRGVPAGDVTAIVVREDLWTTELARTAREAGGAFVAHERLGVGGTEADEAAGDDIIDRLERLAELWKREILTDAEFVEQKTRLLSD